MQIMKKALRFAKKLIFWIFFVALFIVTVLTVILHVYEDDIKAYAVNEINRSLNTKVEVRNIELTFLKDFPNASLAFDHVFIQDAFKGVKSKDTLFFAEDLYLHFNLLDIYSGKYEVKKASVANAVLNLKTTKKGDVNYDIVKDHPDDSTDGDFTFKLTALIAEKLRFNYTNLSTNQFYNLKLNRAAVKGDFSADEYELAGKTDLYVNALKSGSLNLIQNKSASLNLALKINSVKKSYKFSKGDLTVEHMKFDVRGRIDSSSIDLKVKGKQISIAEFFSSIVDEKLIAAQQYQSEGVVDFNAAITGPLSRLEMPSITADFLVENGSLIEPQNQLKLYGIHLDGSYQNAQVKRKELLDIKDFRIQLLNGSINGACKIVDFSQPEISSNVKGDLDLGAVQNFFKFNGIQELSGEAKVDLAFVIQFFDPEYRKDQFEIMQSAGSLDLANVQFQQSENELLFQDISGQFRLQDKDVAAKDFQIKTPSSNLQLNGAFKNVFAYIEGTGNLGLIATLESNKLDLNEFIGESNNNSDGPLEQFEFPGNLNLNVELDIGSLRWENHSFSEITGQLLLANRKATVNNIHLKTLDGDVSGNLVVDNRLQDGNSVDSDLKFTHINLRQLFYEWDNFQQSSILHENISGFASGDIDLLLIFNPYFSIIEQKIYALSNLKISNGELINLATMKAITDYMRSNAAMKVLLNKHIDGFEKKLQHIRFSTIENTIEVKDRKIIIPKMEISSDAMTVQLSGWHDFDNNIEYHFSFRFKELKSRVSETEFGTIEDDGLGLVIYLSMTGSLDDPIYSLDKKERQEEVKENLNKDKQDIKSMLKTDFGLFKKDSTVQKVERNNKEEVDFIFYEEDVEEEQTTNDKPVKKKNKSRIGKFFDELKPDEKKEEKQIELNSPD
jgi:hypothetical protein